MNHSELQEATETTQRTMRTTVAQLGDLRAAWKAAADAVQSYWMETNGLSSGVLVHLGIDERRRLRESAARLEEESAAAIEALRRVQGAAGAVAHALNHTYSTK